MKLKNILFFVGLFALEVGVRAILPQSENLQAIAPLVLAGLISAGGGILSSIAGNIGKGKRADKEAQGIQRIADQTLGKLNDYTSGEQAAYQNSLGQLKSLSDLFGKQASNPYLDTTEGQAFQSMIDERSRKNKDRLRSDMGLMGGTMESYLAGLDKINQQEGSSLRDLVAGADQRRNQLRGYQLGSLNSVLSGQSDLLRNKNYQANTALNFGSGVYNRSQARNDSMTNNVNNSFQNAAMLAFQGFGGGNNMKNIGATAAGLIG